MIWEVKPHHDIQEVLLIHQKAFTDERGGFLKGFNKTGPFEDFEIRQINIVDTQDAYTIRGLHFQKDEFAESKVFRVLKGKALFACIDVRKDSKTYGIFVSTMLDAPEKTILVPRGFATGYLTLEANTQAYYLSDNDYYPEAEGGVRYNDPKLKAVWPEGKFKVSEKDLQWSDL